MVEVEGHDGHRYYFGDEPTGCFWRAVPRS
jgi:hypothetical protein